MNHIKYLALKYYYLISKTFSNKNIILKTYNKHMGYFKICRLPRDIFYILWELLGIDMNNLILASSVIYRMCFREMRWWRVRLKKDAILFCSDEMFRLKLLSVSTIHDGNSV